MSLLERARAADSVLEPAGQLDVVLFSALAAAACESYLGNRELATSIHIPDGPALLKRGSKLPALTASELASAVDERFLALRKEPGHLDDAREELTEAQDRVWQYFFPRKYAEFFYATNHEEAGKPIDRIFYDIDRGENVSAEDALAVTRAFVDFLREDETAADVTDRTVISWTGASFHVELLLKEFKPAFFYDNHVFTSETSEVDTITERGVNHLQGELDVDVVGAHEKQEGKVAIDPSQTPSGKLNRVPLGSLHMKDATMVDGVSIPLTREELHEEGVLDMLQSYTPQTVLEDWEELSEKV